jgi:aspartyl/asparaginyl beta-hydroxylase (cupin superfamily)
MSTSFGGVLTNRDRTTKAAKFIVRRILFPLGVLAPFAFFFPKTALFYAACGAYDISRNRDLELSTLRRYFIGNGFLTWVLSPVNILLDLLSLPYVNKGVYRLEDLPPACQDEVRRLIRVANEQSLVAKIEERAKQFSRTMVFFRWYGGDADTFLDIPEFHEGWKYVQTIGVSVFNKKVSTSKHFGYLRASLRVLYNLNDMKDDSTYIVVGDTTQYWRENKLFIFDDTLLHQSFNETDQPRYCMFVDILRPTPFPRVMAAVVTTLRMLSKSFKFVYYKHWKIIER